jgi:hypothetical protein
MSKQMQFLVLYEAVEDRILLRVKLVDGTEMKFHCTRRMVRGLFEAAGKMAEAQLAGGVAPAQKKMVADFGREHAVRQGDYKSAFRDGADHPEFGAAPRLLRGVQLTLLDNGKIRVSLQVPPKQQLNFELTGDSLWGLVHLFHGQAARGGWDLEAPINAAAPAMTGTVN